MSASVKFFVKKRLDEMYNAPEMWAYSKEAFAAQLRLLMELAGVPETTARALYVVCGVNDQSQAIEEVTAAWGQKTITWVTGRLNGQG